MNKCPCIDCLVIATCKHKSWMYIATKCSLVFNYVTQTIVKSKNFNVTIENDYENRICEVKQMLGTRERRKYD